MVPTAFVRAVRERQALRQKTPHQNADAHIGLRHISQLTDWPNSGKCTGSSGGTSSSERESSAKSAMRSSTSVESRHSNPQSSNFTRD